MKSSKDSDYSLVSNKNLNHEIGSLDRLPGDDVVIQKCKNYDVITKNPKSESFQFWKNRNYTFSGFSEGLNSSLALAAGELWSQT